MKTIIYFFVLLFFSLPIQANEKLSINKKNIKDILLDISEKIESLEKVFLFPDNGYIEDGEASIALVELDKLRIRLKRIEGQVEKIEYMLANSITDIESNIEKISEFIKSFDISFELNKEPQKPLNSNKILFSDSKDLNALNDFESLKRAKLLVEKAKYEDAKLIFENFVKNFPNDSLLPEVFFYLAEIYYNINEWKLAANSYLESFSLDPKGNFAPKALFGLSVSLGALKQFDQACLTLDEVSLRFPAQSVITPEDIFETKKLLNCN